MLAQCDWPMIQASSSGREEVCSPFPLVRLFFTLFSTLRLLLNFSASNLSDDALRKVFLT